MNQAKKRMISTVKEIEKVYDKNRSSTEEYIEMIDGTWGIWVRLADQDYNVLYTSKSEKNTNKVLSQRIINIIDAGKENLEEQGYYFSEVSKEEDNIIRLVYVKKMDNKTYMILSRSVKSVYENIETANQLTVFTSLILMMVGFLFIFHFSKNITKPILEIGKNAKEISKLNFSQKLKIRSNNEIGVLAESINEISDKLSISIEELKTDINDRKELVRNMSHELKTPIAAVKGYAEGLKYAVADSPEKMNKYCDVIVAECNRMDALVKEMLELSKMESIHQEIQKEKFNASKLEEALKNCFGEQIKNSKIDFQIKGNPAVVINGDYNLIERAMFNYIENALNYVNQNGHILIRYDNYNKGFLFQIYNSGSNICEEEIGDIWKVFYKADKSRTRQKNNYGVGLAIVKTTIDLHHGKVDVRNQEEGVEFSFWIPE